MQYGKNRGLLQNYFGTLSQKTGLKHILVEGIPLILLSSYFVVCRCCNILFHIYIVRIILLKKKRLSCKKMIFLLFWK